MGDKVDRSELTPDELAEARPYPLVIEWSPEDDAFIVSVPDLPGVHTHGATREEAAAMGDEVVAIVLGYLRETGRPVPPPSPYSGLETGEHPPTFDADRIREIRRNLGVPQRVFANLLNVSLGAVRSWEQGLRTPDGAATRLLIVAERHPEIIIEAASLSAMTSDRRAHRSNRVA
jgi:predicted RNase H-like HicB family nuclease/DNA-binding XRE family transcriptional regulator